MTIFEPLFLLLLLVSLISAVRAGILALRGRGAQSLRILRRLAAGALVYFAAGTVWSWGTPRRVFHAGEMQCFDDWCITVANVTLVPSSAGMRYDISLRLSSRAKRVPMGEKGTVVYLEDATGRRYDPEQDTDAIPFDHILQPGESVLADRHFNLPTDARNVGLIYTHEPALPIGLIIGEGGWWFWKPPIVLLDKQH